MPESGVAVDSAAPAGSRGEPVDNASRCPRPHHRPLGQPGTLAHSGLDNRGRLPTLPTAMVMVREQEGRIEPEDPSVLSTVLSQRRFAPVGNPERASGFLRNARPASLGTRVRHHRNTQSAQGVYLGGRDHRIPFVTAVGISSGRRFLPRSAYNLRTVLPA